MHTTVEQKGVNLRHRWLLGGIPQWTNHVKKLQHTAHSLASSRHNLNAAMLFQCQSVSETNAKR